MKFSTCLLNVALFAAAAQAQGTSCWSRLQSARDDLHACSQDLDTCEQDLQDCKDTPHGLAYDPVNCPGHKNGNIRVSGDEAFKVFCDSYNKGTTMTPSHQTPNVEECMSICDVTHGCVGADYYPSTQTCYLKSSGLSDATIGGKTGVIAFYNVGYL